MRRGEATGETRSSWIFDRHENAELRIRLDIAPSAADLLVERGLIDEVFELFDAAL